MIKYAKQQAQLRLQADPERKDFFWFLSNAKEKDGSPSYTDSREVFSEARTLIIGGMSRPKPYSSKCLQESNLQKSIGAPPFIPIPPIPSADPILPCLGPPELRLTPHPPRLRHNRDPTSRQLLLHNAEPQNPRPADHRDPQHLYHRRGDPARPRARLLPLPARPDRRDTAHQP